MKRLKKYERDSWDIESEYYKRTGEIPARHLLIEFDEQPFIKGFLAGCDHVEKINSKELNETKKLITILDKLVDTPEHAQEFETTQKSLH